MKGSINCLCHVMVSMLAIGPKVQMLKPSRGDLFLRARKFAACFSLEGK
jgi:hypothetical protein